MQVSTSTHFVLICKKSPSIHLIAVDNCPKVTVKWLPNEEDFFGTLISVNLSLPVAKVYIGELLEQRLTLNFIDGDEVLEEYHTTWKMENYTENQITTPVKFGPLYRNRTYTPIVTIKTQLSYEEDDGSIGIFSHISETCTGRSFMATEWTCLDGENSIPVHLVCNAPLEPDCPDGSDEASVLCTGGFNNIVTGSIVAYFLLGVAATSLGM